MSDPILVSVLMLALGWLAGLLTGPIGDAIRQKREARELAGALSTEFSYLRELAAATAYVLRARHGTLTRERRHWLAESMADASSEESRRIADAMRESLKLSDQQIEALNHSGRTDVGLSVRSLETPFLDAQIHRLGVFALPTQERILRTRVQVRMHNELADEARKYALLTFDGGLMPQNRANATANSKLAEERVAVRAEEIVRAIQAIGRIK